MEKSTENTIIENVFLGNERDYTRSREVLLFPVEKQRFMFYDKRLHDFVVLRVSETDTHIYWSEDKFTPRFNGKLFFSTKGVTGISLEKKTRNVKFWFGKQPHYILLDSFIARMNVSWWQMLPHNFKSYFSAGLFKAIAKNKINSVEDYALYLSKHSLMFKGLDSSVITKLIYTNKIHEGNHLSLNSIAALLQIAIDPLVAIDVMFTVSVWFYEQFINRAQALNEKIDFSSVKALDLEKARIKKLYDDYCEKYGIQNSDAIPF